MKKRCFGLLCSKWETEFLNLSSVQARKIGVILTFKKPFHAKIPLFFHVFFKFHDFSMHGLFSIYHAFQVFQSLLETCDYKGCKTACQYCKLCASIIFIFLALKMHNPIFKKLTFESTRDKTNKMAYAPSEDSDQAVRMKKAWVLSYPLSAQRRLWSDWADAQADLSLRCAQHHFVGFVTRWLILPVNKGELGSLMSLAAKWE